MTRRGRLLAGMVALAAIVGALTWRSSHEAQASNSVGHVVLWHAYRGDELTALTDSVQLARAAIPGLDVEMLAVPFDAYASKLERSIPHDHGPDLFIDAHERLASYIARRLVIPLDTALSRDPDGRGGPRMRWEPTALDALTRDGHTYAFPLSFKCLALYVNTRLVPEPPASLEAVEALRGRLPAGIYPLVYYAQNAYFHMPLAHAYGSGLVDDASGRYLFVGDGAERSIRHAMRLVHAGVVPDEADGSLASRLFANGRAATAISGPWLAGELGRELQYTVVPLPRIEALGTRMTPFTTVEGVFVSSHARNRTSAERLARFLAEHESAVVRARLGRQVVATISAWSDPRLAGDTFLATFRNAAREARTMPTHPNMRAAFVPANQALAKAFRGDSSIHDALVQGRDRFDNVTRPLPRERNPRLALFAIGLIGLYAAFAAVRRARDPVFRRDLSRSVPAYRYVTHAVIVIGLLVVAPLLVGASTSLFAGREGSFYYVGLANYIDIVTARGGALIASGSFYVVLGVTVLWTLTNIALHVGIGVALALLLSRPLLRMKGIYRVLLIIPWAVPSYVTALAWKGMFHRQLGAINAVLATFGVDPVAWFARFSTSFAANVATNVWLGFPFMMVVTLGALAAIPKDLYEAAAVDGATAAQRFWRITMPLLKPSLAPAVAMGSVWTFNQFNVIFLVSGGEPDSQTEILVTEAYRWAFTRQAQYGYAAAYAVLIFGILVVLTRTLDRATASVSR